MCSQPTVMVSATNKRVDATIMGRVPPATRDAAAKARVVGIEPTTASQDSWASKPIETVPCGSRPAIRNKAAPR